MAKQYVSKLSTYPLWMSRLPDIIFNELELATADAS